MEEYHSFCETDFTLNRSIDSLKPIEVSANKFFKLGDSLP